MFETGDFQTPAPPESGVADNAVASTPQDHWLYNELVDGFHIDRVVRDYNSPDPYAGEDLPDKYAVPCLTETDSA